ncbi:hypothetical protein TELCIR_11345, partial [Teladorsagia circumcincta]
MADIDYFWGRQRSDPRQSAVVFGNFMLPQFKQTCYHVNYTQATTSSELRDGGDLAEFDASKELRAA